MSENFRQVSIFLSYQLSLKKKMHEFIVRFNCFNVYLGFSSLRKICSGEDGGIVKIGEWLGRSI